MSPTPRTESDDEDIYRLSHDVCTSSFAGLVCENHFLDEVISRSTCKPGNFTSQSVFIGSKARKLSVHAARRVSHTGLAISLQ